MSVEKAIAAGIEPVLDMMVEIEGRVKQVEARQPIPGPPPDPMEVANLLVELYGKDLKGEPGEPGQPGADGQSVSLHEVAGLVAEEYAEQLRGPPGDSPNLADIAGEVFQKYGERLKGDPGEDGSSVSVEDVVTEILTNHLEEIKGEPGRDGVEGAQGIKGDPGRDGDDADPVDPEVVADLIFTKFGDSLKGEKGEKGLDGLPAPLPDPKEIAETIVEEYGPQLKGDKGEPGRDGLGINSTTWKQGVFREGSVVQHNIGQYFMAMRDTAEEPGRSEDWQRMGKAGFRWTGLKVDGREYEEGDYYIDNGTTFLFVEGKGRMVAKRGDPGRKGDKGDQGDSGPPAPMIAEVIFDENGIVVALDDGTLLEAKSQGLEDYITMQINKATEGFQQAMVEMADQFKSVVNEVKLLRKAK